MTINENRAERMQIGFSKAAPPKTGAVIVPAFEGALKSGAFAAFNKATAGALGRAGEASGFTGKKDQAVEVMAPAGLANSRIVALGAGKAKDFDARAAEALGGLAMARLAATQEKRAAVALAGFESPKLKADETAARIAYGALLRSYRFDKYRTKLEKDQKPQLKQLTLHTASGSKAAFASLEKISDAVLFARDLVSEPPNVLYPESFANRCKTLEALGLKVTVLGVRDMKKLGMGSLLGVAQGSVREPRIVAMEWIGGRKGAAPAALVGKGVCFDSGGISLKPPAGMEDMKWDMGGAAAVTGAMMALAGRKARANVVGVIGLVENMPDGGAQRPSDIVTSMSGQTIEVINTDAEGRLVLADVIWWTQETFKPDAIVDLATLTGAIIIALGHEYAGLFANNEKLAGELIKAGEATDELLWRMPISKANDEAIKSDAADMKNTGPREGGSSSAAAFIARFVKDGAAWAHLDIAGRAWSTKDSPLAPKGATGFGVRLLDEWVQANRES
jgi:leucyl aminopeptidase